MSKSKDTFKRLTDVSKNMVKQQVDGGQALASKAKDMATDVQRKYEESGAKEKVDAIQSQLSETLDELSGQAMYQLVQERLAEQERFNDLLATKLHEALERISQLEKQLGDE